MNMMSKSHIKASAKYNKANYKSFQVQIKIDDYNKIAEYCEDKGISKAQFLIKAFSYIQDNNINLGEMSTE